MKRLALAIALLASTARAEPRLALDGARFASPLVLENALSQPPRLACDQVFDLGAGLLLGHCDAGSFWSELALFDLAAGSVELGWVTREVVPGITIAGAAVTGRGDVLVIGTERALLLHRHRSTAWTDLGDIEVLGANRRGDALEVHYARGTPRPAPGIRYVDWSIHPLAHRLACAFRKGERLFAYAAFKQAHGWEVPFLIKEVATSPRLVARELLPARLFFDERPDRQAWACPEGSLAPSIDGRALVLAVVRAGELDLIDWQLEEHRPIRYSSPLGGERFYGWLVDAIFETAALTPVGFIQAPGRLLYSIGGGGELYVVCLTSMTTQRFASAAEFQRWRAIAHPLWVPLLSPELQMAEAVR